MERNEEFRRVMESEVEIAIQDVRLPATLNIPEKLAAWWCLHMAAEAAGTVRATGL